jgi:hypothetical protein
VMKTTVVPSVSFCERGAKISARYRHGFQCSIFNLAFRMQKIINLNTWYTFTVVSFCTFTFTVVRRAAAAAVGAALFTVVRRPTYSSRRGFVPCARSYGTKCCGGRHGFFTCTKSCGSWRGFVPSARGFVPQLFHVQAHVSIFNLVFSSGCRKNNLKTWYTFIRRLRHGSTSCFRQWLQKKLSQNLVHIYT